MMSSMIWTEVVPDEMPDEVQALISSVKQRIEEATWRGSNAIL